MPSPEIGWYEVSADRRRRRRSACSGLAGRAFPALEWHSYRSRCRARATALAAQRTACRRTASAIGLGHPVPRRGDGRRLPALARQLHRRRGRGRGAGSIRSRSREQTEERIAGWNDARTRDLRALPCGAKCARFAGRPGPLIDMYEALFDQVLQPDPAGASAHRCICARSTRSPAARAHATGCGGSPTSTTSCIRVSALGLDFPSPLGVAAGLDKDAEHFEGLGALGFGFVEVGTVTPRAQDAEPAADPRARHARPRPAESHGLSEQGRRSCGEAPRSSAVTDGRRRQHRQEPRDAARAGRRRLRAGGADRRAVRGLPGAQRQLAEHAGAARPRVGCAAAAAVEAVQQAVDDNAAARQDQPGSERRGRRCGRRPGARARARRDRRDQHDAAAGGPAHPGRGGLAARLARGRRGVRARR